MIKSAYISIGSALVMSALAAIMPAAAFAQTMMAGDATMPPLYTVQGVQVNNGNLTPLPAGTYYLQIGGQQPVEYYGNGMYYNPSTQLYGGSSVNDPNGRAGADLGYSAMVETPSTIAAAPSAPNTGAGGGAPGAWAAILASGAVVLAGLAYIGTYSFRRMNTVI